MISKVNLAEKFGQFDECWSPKILGEVNDSHVKCFKAKGEFVWHRHEHEDEMFLVVKGTLRIQIAGQEEVVLQPGEFLIIPKGVDHMPYADEEAHVLLFEPKGVVNTGNKHCDKTVGDPERL